MTRISGWLLALIFTFGAVGSGSAQVPLFLNYQGRLLNGTNLVNGNVGLSLRLFNVPAGGSRHYEDSNTVTVADGLYSTLIGDGTTAGSLVAALTNPAVYVEVAVNGVALTPRERLVGDRLCAVAARPAGGHQRERGRAAGSQFGGGFSDWLGGRGRQLQPDRVIRQPLHRGWRVRQCHRIECDP
jgi:hypothetical protein